MKKILIVFVFLLAIFTSFNVKADSNSDLSHYYSSLNYNISENVKGTCTYVATCMLLSYYDTYLNDNIIPDQYDAVSNYNYVSPGVYHENLSAYAYDDNIYKQSLLALSDVSLQAKTLPNGC